MASEKRDEITISYRLGETPAAALRRICEQAKCASVHEMARTLLIFTIEQQPAWDEIKALRSDVHQLRTALARSVECLLMNSATELSEADTKKWVFEKLWPDAREGAL